MTVVPVRATHEDPVVGKFLGFLAKDIEQRPEVIKSLSADFAARMASLVKGTEVDLDEPIDGDVDLRRHHPHRKRIQMLLQEPECIAGFCADVLLPD